MGYDVGRRPGTWVAAQGAHRRNRVLVAGVLYGAVTLTSTLLALTHQLSLLESAMLIVGALAIRPFAYAYIDRHRLLSGGEHAEIAVGTTLEGLRREGWIVMHDIEHPGFGNIDHVVRGPGGVFLIETKLRRYEDRALGKVKKQAALLHDSTGEWVTPVIVIHEREKEPFTHRGVAIVPHRHLLDWLRRRA